MAAAPAAPVAGDDNVAELKEKLASYQNFMAKYIVEAQEAKARAIAEAQAAVAAKYEAKLLLAPAAPAETAAPKVYQDRSARISAAAAAGKSRWGESEVARIATGVNKAPVMQPAAAVSASAVTVVSSTPPAEVAEADHGLRNDGGVGGPSLADRITQGASLPGGPVPSNKLYDRRSNFVSEAGGKSRWGESEIARLATGTATAPAMKPAAPALGAAAGTVMASAPAEVAEADHGLRNDGGVTGPSLAERVTQGATLAAGEPIAANNALYDKRSQFVSEAAGKSRWGEAELARLATGTATAPAMKVAAPALGAAEATVMASAPSEVAEADHGLRNDGGVTGPTLAERVTQGATLAAGEPIAAAVNGVTIGSPNQVLYYIRNQHIAASGEKSRWGPMEVAKATGLAALPKPVVGVPEQVVQAADHGLRSDGGVGGPSLSERVNLGAQLLGQS